MRSLNSTALVALLLAGCGGGGSEPTAVSANPPAPAPAPGPATSPPLVAATPTPSPGPASPPTPTQLVDAAVVSQALGTQIMGPVGAQTQGRLLGGTTMAYVAQDFHRDANDPGTYTFESGDASGATPDSTHPAVTFIDIRNSARDQAGAWLGTVMMADLTFLEKEGGLLATGRLPLDSSLGQWNAAPWYADLRINQDVDPALFRLCWRVRLPNIDRLSCGKFDRLTAAFRGVYISDNSFGQQANIWTSQ
jgi:hypothetical protein